ncbi:hypothetical protein Q4493_15380 [Colwellia sp. 1_MG-2023]|uniref:hypothetical protein n=1 Tax=Colwellia sp. 1_MG-2023 TaxID=3062649 RepID=UPI0026E12E82|nr:hypothetical protein [Colwellia sp. 1_MG-2023]MDO6447152.1 hypothetical protein [Colwellia sp. 1_MG-2023]
MTIKNTITTKTIDTSNLGFQLAQPIKKVFEDETDAENDSLIQIFIPPIIKPKSFMSFVTVERKAKVWQLVALEVYEVLGDRKTVGELGYLRFANSDWDELKSGLSKNRLIQMWQTDFVNQLERHGGVMPNSNFTREHIALISQANTFYAQLVEEKLSVLI